MNPFEFKNLSTHTLVLTEEDNPVISVEDDKLILKAFRDNTGLIIVFPASVLVNYKSKETRETTKLKQQRQQSKQRPVRIVTRTTSSNRGAPGEKRYPYNVGEFNPLEVFTEIGKLVYFQPATNHVLAHWGKAVRNCVGSAGYYKYVVDRKSLIILITKDDKPWCTAKFSVRSGVLEADQIVQIQNKSLMPVETAAVAFGLSKVLNDLEEPVS